MEIITQTAGAVTDFLHNPLRNTQHNDGNFERESALIEGVEGPSLAASDLAETQSAGSAKNPAPGVAHLRSRRLPGADPMDNPKLLSALRLARRWTLSVFPVIENGKSPAFAGWQSAATNNPGQIRRWWEENPHYNIGIDTQRLLVLDVDAR